MTGETKKKALRLTDVILVMIVVVALDIILLGCIEEEGTTNGGQPALSDEARNAKGYCISFCAYAEASELDLSDGPCLSDEYESMWNVTDWVCDVAHDPRIEEIDNNPVNQCQAYGDTAHHFVEVTPTCEFIRAV